MLISISFLVNLQHSRHPSIIIVISLHPLSKFHYYFCYMPWLNCSLPAQQIRQKNLSRNCIHSAVNIASFPLLYSERIQTNYPHLPTRLSIKCFWQRFSKCEHLKTLIKIIDLLSLKID